MKSHQAHYRLLRLTTFLLIITGLGLVVSLVAAEDHSPHGPSEKGDPALGQIRTMPIPNLAQCSFLKRRIDIPFLKERWHLDASGADLMAAHPSVVNASAGVYANHALAIVDTGLKLNGNPAAGPECGLSAESPEKEYGYHGTHVAGITGSKKFGVNCRLRIIAYPVKYHDPTAQKMAGITFGGSNEYNRDTKLQGFDKNDLSRQIRAAADNPQVSVISLSIGFGQDPKTQLDIQYALAKGKWLVFANSNGGKINSRETANLRNFMNRPELFAVGGYSYFGGPYQGSDYGPGVRFYTPAAEVESLDTRYNPNLVSPQIGVSFSGTSMATPALAAILTTLKVVDPQLSAQDANKLLSMTAIVRGGNPPMRQVNGYHAVELLTRARQLLIDTQGKTFNDCLAAAERAIGDKLLATSSHPPRYPTGNSCEEWEHTYTEFRKGYFLSDGKLFGDRIKEILAASGGEKWAETAYYLGNHGEKKNLADVEPPRGSRKSIKEEYRTAQKFLRGELLPVSDLPKSEQESLLQENPSGFLARLPGIPENLSSFMRVCEDFLKTSQDLSLPAEKDESGDHLSCADFLTYAPRTFLVGLGQAIAAKNLPLGNPSLPLELHEVATNEFERALAKRLLAQTADNWKNTGNVEDLDSITEKMEWLTPSRRATLLSDFLSRRERTDFAETTHSSNYADHFSHYNLNRLESELRAWAPAEKFGPHADLVEQGLTPYVYTDAMHRAHPDVGAFITSVRRVQAGEGTPGDVRTKLAQLLRQKDAKDSSGDNFTHELAPRDPFISNAFTKAIQDPRTAKDLAELLADPTYFDGLCGVSAYPFVLASRLLEKTDDNRLLETAILAWKKFDEGLSHARKQDLYEYLEANSHIPVVKALKVRIESGPQSDPVGKIARATYLENKAAHATAMIPEVRHYLDEVPGTRHGKLLRVNPAAIVADRELLHELEAHLQDSNADTTPTFEFLAKADPDSFPRLSPLVAPHLGWLLTRLYPGAGLTKEPRQLAHLFVQSDGGNRERMQLLYQGLAKALSALPAEGAENNEERIVEFAQILAQGRAGLEVLANQPGLVKSLASRIARKLDSDLLAYHEPIPQPLREALRQHFPTAAKLNGMNIYTNWVEGLVGEDVGSLNQAVAVLKDPGLADGFGKRMLQRAIRSCIASHPEIAAQTLASLPVGLLPLEDSEN